MSQQKWIWFAQEESLFDLHLFEQASQGLWSAVLLVVRFSHISSMGVVGVLVVVLAVAIGPFAQRIIRYDTCFLPSTAKNATAQRLSYLE